MVKKLGLAAFVCICMCLGGCAKSDDEIKYEENYEESYEESYEEVADPSLSPVELGWESIFVNPSNEEIRSYNENATRRSPYIYGWFTLPEDTRYTEYMIDFKAEHLPKGTYCSLGNWYMDYSYLEKQYESVRVESSIHAYAGFQNTDKDEKVAIMSFWDVFCKDYSGNETILRPTRTYPLETDGSEDFTGEGTGTHCIVPYEWKAGKWYRMHLVSFPSQQTGNTVVEQWVCDLETGEYTILCGYDTGVPNSAFKGSIAVFLENYLPEYAGDIRSMEIKNARYLEEATGKWVALTDAYVGSDSGLPNYEGSYDFGVSNGNLWMITSGVGGDWFNDGRGKKATTLNISGIE